MSDRERVEALAKVVTEHREDFSEHCCWWHDGCGCGWKDSGDEDSSNAAYAGHLIQAVLDSSAMRDLLAEAKADAWDEGRASWAVIGINHDAGERIVELHPNPYRETSKEPTDDVV